MGRPKKIKKENNESDDIVKKKSVKKEILDESSVQNDNKLDGSKNIKEVEFIPAEKKLNNNGNNINIKYIIHLADIHLGKQKDQSDIIRLTEYIDVFESLFKKIREIVIDKNIGTTDGIIIICGDIVQEIATQPEWNDCFLYFLMSLLAILPVIIISGNHDKKKDRMSYIEPYIKAVNNQNLYYLKDSGIYTYGNIKFGVTSIEDAGDEKWKFVRASKITLDYCSQIKIALCHATIGQRLKNKVERQINKNILVSDFDGYDLVLLGDDHTHKYMNEQKTIGYSGSLIQQDFGEEMNNHGFILWEFNKTKKFVHTSKLIPIQNEYAFVSLHVMNGEIQEKDIYENFPKKATVKLIVKDTGIVRINEIKQEISKRTLLQDTIRVSFAPSENLQTQRLNEINDATVHKLFKDYFKDKSESEFEQIKNILDRDILLIKTNDEIERTKKKFKLIYLEFKNMLVYADGSTNSINFENMKSAEDMKNVYGLLAPNGYGKSSIVDIILYSIHGKYIRGKIPNIHKKNKIGETKIIFELDGVRYYIKRLVGHKASDVIFRTVESNENVFKTILDGIGKNNEEKISKKIGTKKKNNAITKFLGSSVDDFISTCVMLQSNDCNFVAMNDKERKTFLNKVFYLYKFDKLYELALKKQKSIESEKKEAESQFDEMKLKLSSLDMSVFGIQEAFIKCIENSTIDDFQYCMNEIRHFCDLKTSLIEKRLNDYNILRNKLTDKIIEEKSKGKITIIVDKTFDDDINKTNIEICENKISFLNSRKNEIITCKEPNILRDTHNIIAKNKNVQAFLKHSKKCCKTLTISCECSNCHEMHKNIMNCMQANIVNALTEEYDKELCTLYNTFELFKIDTEINIITEQLNNLISQKKKYDADVKLVQKLEKTYDITARHITNYTQKIEKLNSDIVHLNRQIGEIKIIRCTTETYITHFSKFKENYNNIICNSQLYKQYTNALSPIDGIPFTQMHKYIKTIEEEINKFLMNIVDYTVSINFTNKKKDGIVVETSNWGQDMSSGSGSEKFLISLAFRYVFTKLSNCVETNFMIIDEGISVLDSEKQGNIHKLFDVFSKTFDFIIIMTHIDKIKSFFNDNNIYVTKVANTKYSYVKYP